MVQSSIATAEEDLSLGPTGHLRFTDVRGRVLSNSALERAVDALRMGWIVASHRAEGLHLLTDATNRSAVQRLRDRTGRPQEPLTVLLASVEAADRYVLLDAWHRHRLATSTAPLLLRQRGGTNLAPEVTPGLDQVGVTLPCSSLLDLLSQGFKRPLVCIHLSLCPGSAPAQDGLIGVADAILTQVDIRPTHSSRLTLLQGG